MSLFASGYETKVGMNNITIYKLLGFLATSETSAYTQQMFSSLQPALSVPIHVVELTNVPPELRMKTGSPLPKPSDTKQVPEAEKDKVG